MPAADASKRLPAWFRKRRQIAGERYTAVKSLVRGNRLNTVCQSAACPNRAECWNRGAATFMILGNLCTRSCGFCNVPKGTPQGIVAEEPERVADAVSQLGLDYAVVTSVTRDDIPDGGAVIFAETIRAITNKSPTCKVEALVPDFQGSHDSLMTVLEAKPAVLSHNLETVPSLYKAVRPKADYGRSLELLQNAKSCGAVVKTGIMLGLGEGMDQIRAIINDLCSIKCDVLTLGQYLRPGKNALPVMKYYNPEEFRTLRDEALDAGIRQVASGPLVRSSYLAGQFYADINATAQIPLL